MEHFKISEKIESWAKEKGMFIPVVRDGDTVRQVDRESDGVPPTSCVCGQLGSNFVPSKNRRAKAVEKADWLFKLHLAFPVEVDPSPFEDFISRDLAIDPSLNIEIRPRRVVYQDPPKNKPTNGSELEYFFEAVPRRL